jgi:hypothetical protein
MIIAAELKSQRAIFARSVEVQTSPTCACAAVWPMGQVNPIAGGWRSFGYRTRKLVALLPPPATFTFVV